MSIATQGVRFGAFTPTLAGGDALEAVNLWEQRMGTRLSVANNFRKFGGDSGNFELAKKSLQQVASHGRVPMISWEPMLWDNTMGPYSLGTIAAGDHDDYITEWAQGLRALGFPMYIRFAHEMNGNWYHWCGDPSTYVRAWRHIVNIFDAEGVGNVSWVWCVNASDAPWGQNPMEKYWPGESYVDVMAIDGYNCYNGWRSFEQIIRPMYDRLCKLHPDKPIWVAETATSEPSLAITGAFTETGVHTKAEWIRELFATQGFDRIETICWFDQANPKSYDWRIDSSLTAMYELRRQLRAATGHVEAPPPYVPPVPDRVTLVPDGPGALRISWRVVPSFTRGYKVLHKTSEGYELEATVLKPQLSYRITNLVPGETYTFAVASYTMVRTSAASQLVTCTVQ